MLIQKLNLPCWPASKMPPLLLVRKHTPTSSCSKTCPHPGLSQNVPPRQIPKHWPLTLVEQSGLFPKEMLLYERGGGVFIPLHPTGWIKDLRKLYGIRPTKRVLLVPYFLIFHLSLFMNILNHSLYLKKCSLGSAKGVVAASHADCAPVVSWEHQHVDFYIYFCSFIIYQY